jgi:YVTN family beta-propeller protein
VAVGRSPRGIAANPGGTLVYAANMYDDTISVIDTGSNTVLHTLTAGDGAYDVAVSPDGKDLYVTNAFEGTVSVLRTDGSSPAPSGYSAMSMTASAPEEATWGTVVLTGFPPGGRVFVDGEFPRWEGSVEGGYAVSFPAGTRTLHLICPGYLERAFPVSAGPGETVSVDGQMMPE